MDLKEKRQTGINKAKHDIKAIAKSPGRGDVVSSNSN
jgi:hypothetical protein